MIQADERHPPDWRWAMALAMGTPLTVLIVSDWLGVPSNPHSITILVVPLAVLGGVAAIPVAAYLLGITLRSEGFAGLRSPRILGFCALGFINILSLSYALPRMRW